MRDKNNYPVYRLHWALGFNRSGRYHTMRKKSFLYRLDRLKKLQTLKKLWFMIEYAPKLKNESIEYEASDHNRAMRDARIFTSASEIKEILKNKDNYDFKR